MQCDLYPYMTFWEWDEAQTEASYDEETAFELWCDEKYPSYRAEGLGTLSGYDVLVAIQRRYSAYPLMEKLMEKFRKERDEIREMRAERHADC